MNNEKKSIDTRSLVEIWGLQPREKQRSARIEVMKKLDVCERAANYYIRGERTPKSPLDRKAISDIVNKEFGLNTRSAFLFPER